MDAKKYTVYPPDEAQVTCRVYVRCNCGHKPCKQKYDHIQEDLPTGEQPLKLDGNRYSYIRNEDVSENHPADIPTPMVILPQIPSAVPEIKEPEKQPAKQPEKQPAEEPMDRGGHKCHEEKQTHVHEFLGSVKLAEKCCERHNHRFAGVSGEVIPIPCGHVHRIVSRTDFFDHFHEINRLSGPAIYVNGDGTLQSCADGIKHHEGQKHVHFVDGWTSWEDGHKHEFQAATLIESPLLPEPRRDEH